MESRGDRVKTKVAVLGAGHLGTFHARHYAQHPDAELALVVDVVEERARRLGEELNVAWSTSASAAFETVDALSIASPTTTHHELGLAALAARRHLLIEKPIATTDQEANELVAAAERADRVLAVGHVERWNPAFRAARPRIGRPSFIEAHRLAPFVARSLDVDVVLDLMIHDLDLVLALVGETPASIDAVGVPVLTPGEDIANARLSFPSGAVANLTASRVSREKVRKLRCFGARRYVSIDLGSRGAEEVLLEAVGPGSAPPPPESPPELRALGLALRHGRLEVPSRDALGDQLADFIAAVRGAPLEGASGQDGALALRAALEVSAKIRQARARLA